MRRTELAKLNVGGWGRWKGSKFAPTRPALFSEVLALVRERRSIYVEVKGDDPTWVPYIKAEVERARNVNPGNVLFISFGSRVCAELKRQLPEYWVYYLTSEPGLAAEALVSRLKALGVDGVDIRFDPAVHDAAYVRTVKDAGFGFHVWTIDDLATARQTFAAGADTLTTNCAKALLDGHRSGR